MVRAFLAKNPNVLKDRIYQYMSAIELWISEVQSAAIRKRLEAWRKNNEKNPDALAAIQKLLSEFVITPK